MAAAKSAARKKAGKTASGRKGALKNTGPIPADQRTTTLVIAALGGEGGGVLAQWITQTASDEGWISQATSVPGVAQRTGATIYYIELFDRSLAKEGEPVMSLFPMEGDVDIVLASEALEAARMVQRGLVTPDRTTLIASDSRSFAVAEKAMPADGITSQEQLLQATRLAARRFLHYDMQEITARHGTVISATLLGALAGASVLPFKKEAWERTLQQSGRGAEASLAAFAESYERAVQPQPADTADSVKTEAFVLPEPTTEGGTELIRRIADNFPPQVHEILYHAVARLADYQDHNYAHSFLDRLEPVLELDNRDPSYRLTAETGRFLALWMAFEDIARVAQLKIRSERTERIRKEVRADPEQPIQVREFMRPQVRELVSFFPRRIGQAIIHSPRMQKLLKPLTGGRIMHTSGISGFCLLYLLSLLRLVRRQSWIMAEETGRIEQWLNQVRRSAEKSQELGLEVALCGRLIKGYSNTRERSFNHMERILEALQNQDPSAQDVATLRQAALKDETGAALSQALAELKKAA